MNIAKITIAIPFYANVAYLQETVGSALAQTNDEFFLLISDDCGPESGAAEAYIKNLNEPRITYIRQEQNLGLAGNWNFCLRHATTEFVTLLHADDKLAPDYIEKMLPKFDEHLDAAMIFCNSDIINRDGQPAFSFPDFVKRILTPKSPGDLIVSGDTGVASLLKGCYIMCPTICYRSSYLADLQFSSTWKMVLDLDFYSKVLLAGGKIVGIQNRLYKYRRHAGNQTSFLTASLVRFEEETALYNSISANSRAIGWTLSAKLGRRKTIIKLNLLYCILGDLLKLRVGPAAQKVRYLLFGMKSPSDEIT